MRRIQRVFIFILLINTNVTNAQEPPTEEEFQLSLQLMENALESNSSDTILAGAMLAQIYNPELVPQYLNKTINPIEKNRLRLNLAVLYCQSTNDPNYCTDNHFIDELVEKDSNNLEPYLYLMVHLLNNGDDVGGLNALKQALKTEETNDYYLEKLDISRRILRQIGYPANKVNGASELNALSSFPALYYNILSICPDKSETDDNWKQACLDLGIRLEESGRTILPNMVGFGIQRDIWQKSALAEDVEKLNAVLERRASYVLVRNTLRDEVDWWPNPASRPDLFYEEAISLGEMPAMKRILERENLSHIIGP